MSGSRAAVSAEELERINAEERKKELHKKFSAQEGDMQRARAAKAEASGDNEILQFEKQFGTELRTITEALEGLAVGTSEADASATLADLAKRAEALHATIAAAAHFLPVHLRETSSRSTNELEAKVRAEKERVAPKKKFGFKNRSKLASGPTQVPAAAAGAAAASGTAAAATTTNGSAIATSGAAAGEAAAAVDAEKSAKPHEDSFAAGVADCVGFRKQRGATLVRAADGTMHGGDIVPAAAGGAAGADGAGAGASAGAGAGAGDFALEELEGCEVRLLCGSTALWIRRLRGCTVVALPLPGSVYVSECADCTFVFGSRQVRLHTSSRCDFYIHAASHPIIERCDAFRFAPYPSPLPPAFAGAVAAAGMDPTRNQWSNVDDFGWLKATASPHWCVLPEAERRSDFDFFTPPSAGGGGGGGGGGAAAAATEAPVPAAAAAATAEGGEITLKVLFFAAAREEAGMSEVTLGVASGTDTETLRAVLLARFPGRRSRPAGHTHGTWHMALPRHATLACHPGTWRSPGQTEGAPRFARGRHPSIPALPAPLPLQPWPCHRPPHVSCLTHGLLLLAIAIAIATALATCHLAAQARFPGLDALLPRCAIARNSSYVDGVVTLNDGDEVAVIPPVSGG